MNSTLMIAQELNQMQVPKYDGNTDQLTFPITSIAGYGVVKDLVITLSPVGSDAQGNYTLGQGEEVMRFDKFYGLSTAAAPHLCLEGAGTNSDSFLSGGCQFTGESWKLVELSNDFSKEDDYFWLQNQHTTSQNVCLTDEVVDGKRRVAMQNCSTSNTQQLWKLTAAVDGFFYIENKSAVGYRECLHGTGSDNGKVGLTACTNDANQLWLIHPLTQDPLFNGKWETDCGFSCGNVIITQKGDDISGTYAQTQGAGTVSGSFNSSTRTLQGSWNRNGGTGSITFKLSDDGLSFTGNFGGTTAWCGWREGGTKPSPCFGP